MMIAYIDSSHVSKVQAAAASVFNIEIVKYTEIDTL